VLNLLYNVAFSGAGDNMTAATTTCVMASDSSNIGSTLACSCNNNTAKEKSGFLPTTTVLFQISILFHLIY
jgi:hypothetical protein